MKKLESSLKNMLLVLTLVTAVATALLAYVNKLTEAPIAIANAKALQNAIKLVVPVFDNDPTTDTVTMIVDNTPCKIYQAKHTGAFVGAAVEASMNGFGDKITILVGFDKEGAIKNYSVLNHKETPGLGSKMDPWFKTDKNAQSILGLNPGMQALKVKKDGGTIDAITASTITSRAFLAAVGKAYKAYIANGATQTEIVADGDVEVVIVDSTTVTTN